MNPPYRRPAPAGRPGGAGGLRWLRWVAVAGIVVAFSVFVVQGANRPLRPQLMAPGAVAPARGVAGFGQIGFRVESPFLPDAAGRTTRCALLADTDATRSKGLMGRHDLAGYQGMVFEFGDQTTTAFYMKDTLIPLSIAWFSATGRYVSSTTMAPCPKNTGNCPDYFADGPYSVAIEVAAGRLRPLGIGPGSTLSVGGPC